MMEIVIAFVVIVMVAALLTRAGPARAKVLSHDVSGPQLAALAERLGLEGGGLDGENWTGSTELAGCHAYVLVIVEPGAGDIEEWSVRRIEVVVDVTLPGQLTLGSRASGRRDVDPNELVPREFDSAYWTDGRPAEVLGVLNGGLSRALVAADRDAPRWTHIALGESAIFERMPQGEYRLADVASDLPALMATADACVRAIPRSDKVLPLLHRRVVSEDEPLGMRLRCAFTLLHEYGDSPAARLLAEELDALPDPLYNACAFWAAGHEGGPSDHDAALVELLAFTLEGADADAIFDALVASGWSPSTDALRALEAHGVDVSAQLDAARAEGAGQLTLADEPRAGGLSAPDAEPGALSRARNRGPKEG